MKYPTIQNPYKRKDVFRCPHPSHHKFNDQVSAYHILKEKKCYPDGCLYFEWHCSLMEKGNRCIKGFQFVGKKCQGCTYYLDEKFHFQPEYLLSDTEALAFEEEQEAFNSWLEEVQYKRLSCAGKIQSVKPWFESHYSHQQKKRIFKGYLLMFQNGFIGKAKFDDTFYVRISEAQMQIHQFITKMRVDFTAELRYDQGRIVLFFPKSIVIQNKGWGYRWTKSKALVALKTGFTMNSQSDQCLSCSWGLLIDVVNEEDNNVTKNRELHCMKGVKDFTLCSYIVFKRVRNKFKRPIKLD